MVATDDVAERFNLRHRIRTEIVPDLRKYEPEYAALLAEVTEPAQLPADESEAVLVEVLQAANAAEQARTDQTPAEMLRLLHEIKEKLDEPGKSAAAKLKVSLPIFPGLIAYELESDTENFLTTVWHKVKSLFARELPDHPH